MIYSKTSVKPARATN